MSGCAALALSMLFAVCAAQWALDREVERLREVRCMDTLAGARQQIEAELALGFDLEDSQRAERVLGEALQAVDGLQSATVFDGAGRTLFDADRSAIGEPVREAWRRAAGAVPWRVASEDTVAIGVPLRGAAGAVVGEMMLTTPLPDGAYPWAAALACAAALAGVAALLVGLPTRASGRALQGMREAPRARLDDAEARVARADDALRAGSTPP